MTSQIPTNPFPTRPTRGIMIGLYLIFLAGVGRTLTDTSPSSVIAFRHLRVLGIEAVFLLLFTLVLWRPPRRTSWLYLYFSLQSAIIVAMLAMMPKLDFVIMFFLLLSYQVAWLFSGQLRWGWIIGFSFVAGAAEILAQGLLQGLALGLVTIAGFFVITAYVIALQEVEAADTRSRAILSELQATHIQLRDYASQVEELAGMEERGHLARDLHDSVSQTLFSIQLNTRSAQLLLEKNPSRVRAQLIILQNLVQSALAEMRRLIVQMRTQGE